MPSMAALASWRFKVFLGSEQVEPRAALKALERMRALIRPEIYRMTRSHLEAFPPRKPKRSSGGESS